MVADAKPNASSTTQRHYCQKMKTRLKKEENSLLLNPYIAYVIWEGM